jgi:tetraacyldisaccharide 4'-kinase
MTGALSPSRRWHARFGRTTRLFRPVISVGNLSTGGRGKTPTVMHLARLLIEAGEVPAILSRGYARRRRVDGVVVVSDGRHLLADLPRAGDEPLMIANAVPGAVVVVCEQRLLAGLLAERAFGATVHLLDDGFQHLALARAIDLVLVTADDLGDRAMPRGRLREPVGALAAADAIIVDAPEATRADVERRIAAAAGRPVFHLRRSLGPPVAVDSGAPQAGVDGPVLALAGIAGPDRFTRSLEQAGYSVATSLAFADHHAYTARDLEAIAGAAAAAGARTVVTTMKDAVRLLPLRPFPLPLVAIPLEVAIEPDAAFRAFLFARLNGARP